MFNYFEVLSKATAYLGQEIEAKKRAPYERSQKLNQTWIHSNNELPHLLCNELSRCTVKGLQSDQLLNDFYLIVIYWLFIVRFAGCPNRVLMGRLRDLFTQAPAG
jgi:hypothetical protein